MASSVLGQFFEFNLIWRFNFWTFLLGFVYITLFVAGYYLISNQVKLVKKETWTNLDRFKCFVYAVFFAGGTEIIIAMMVTFATSKNYAYTAPFIIIPYFYNLIMMTVYPLADFLYMAHSKEELARSPAHKILEKYIINKFRPPYSYFVATVLYFVIFIIPPVLIIIYGKHEFIIVWTSWQMIFPMGIITYYGAKGYITGLVKDYNTIPRMDRSFFLAYDKSNRASQEFFRQPVARIMLPLRIYLYFWTIYSFYITIIKIDPSKVGEGFNTMQYGFTVYLVLFFGVTGYFSRFWGRRTKFKTMDIMYAAFLIAAVGINVMVNFLLVNSDLLEIPFREWEILKVINPISACKFAPAAIIEETVLTLVVTYYLLFTREKGFLNDTIESYITQSGELFDPLIPFNFIKNRDPKKRELSYRVLMGIYDRIPLKKEFSLNSPEFRDPLFDAICDPNPYAQKAGKDILLMLLRNHPKEAISLIKEEFRTYNMDKLRNTLDVLNEVLNDENPGIVKMGLFPLSDVHSHLNLLAFDIKYKAARLLYSFYKFCSNKEDLIALYSTTATEKGKYKPSISQLINESEIKRLISFLDKGDYVLDAIILRILALFPDKVPKTIFSSRIEHPVDEIRAIAADSIGKLDLSDLSSIDLPKLIEMLDSPNVELKAAVMETLSKIGNFKKNNIPIDPFVDGLFAPSRKMRDAAIKGLIGIKKEFPEKFNLSFYLKKLQEIENKGVISSLLEFIGRGWENNIDDILDILLKYAVSEDELISKTASDILFDLGVKYPEKVLKGLLPIKDTEGILMKGKITRLIIKLGKTKPKIVIPILISALKSKNENERIKASSALGDLIDIGKEFIDIREILQNWIHESSGKVKKNYTKILSAISKLNKVQIKRFMPLLLNSLSDPNQSVRLTVGRMLLDIAQHNPDIIPIKAVEIMINDSDPFIRESGIKLAGLLIKEFPRDVIGYIYNGLNDENEFVKTTAGEVLSKVGNYIHDRQILDEIKKLVFGKSKWSRLAALDVIIQQYANDPTFLDIDEVKRFVKDDEPMFRARALRLIEYCPKEYLDETFQILINALEDPNEEVRKSAVSVGKRYSSKFRGEEIIPRFLKYLSDETTLTLQRGIAEILRTIAKYEKAALKKRVVSMLKIRVEVSQDKKLSEILSELQDDKGLSIL